MFQTVLVPIDGSESAERAVEVALDVARTYGAAFHTLYVVGLGGLPPDEDSDAWLIREALESEGRSLTAAVEERAKRAGVDPVESSLLTGTPYRAILDYVDDNDVDLVVMGTHGRSGLDHFLLGSVTERLVRTSPVPVLTVKVPAETD